MTTTRKVGAALVVGAGVGGMQAALDLAEAGIRTYLLDEKGSIGGVMVQLDKTFPTNDCAMCTIAPRLVTTDRHLDVRLLTNSEVLDVSGEVGNFKVKVKKRARYVDMEKCTACGVCVEKCPIKVPSEFDQGLSKRKAIYTLFPQGVPNVPVIDKENCTYFIKGKCRACEKFCEPQAICFDQQDEIIELEVGAIILSPGYELFNPEIMQQLGFERYPNVITSLQFERMLSASGPYAGQFVRLSDNQPPQKMAFIQCVGSRETATDYCSAVCCMYATKEAIIVKEHHPETEVTIFFTDIRAYGKGFEAYYERAKKMGVNYVRCQPSSIKEIPDTKELVIRYQTEKGEITEDCFDMVVLSCGLRPRQGVKELAEKFGVELNQHGFCQTSTFNPVETNREGIYVAGVFSGPKDIPETVMQAGSAASKVLGLLAPEKGTMLLEKIYPTEKEIDAEEPRIGVIVCHCGKNIASVVDIPAVIEYTKTLPNVVHADNSIFACSTDSGRNIQKIINEHNLNRVIIAACTPRTHEGLFQDTLREAGLNPFMLEMANIRNQCSWVHMDEPEQATQKAKDLIRVAVARVKHLEPLHPESVTISHDALVIGGGAAGMTAALELADQGIKTYLLEKSDKLGGNLRRVKVLVGGDDPQKKLDEMIARVENHPQITLYKSAELEEFEGSAGNFSATFTAEGQGHTLVAGAVIVATGGQEYRPSEYLYGQDKRVITQLELEDLMSKNRLEAKTVVMIQCVGSRDEEHAYCSRLCCVQAIKNGIQIMEKDPSANVFVLYRDMRSYGFNEAYYSRARELGVRFIRYEQDEKPEVSVEGGRLKVSVRDPILDIKLNIATDLLILSAGVIPGEDTTDLAKKMKLPLTEDEFFLEAHIKLRPVDFSNDGIFLAGLAHSPKLLDETIAQASAAATRASVILSKKEIELEPCISKVIDENCDGCAYCVDPCPFEAISLIEYMKDGTIKKIVESDSVKCHGCGVCMATCPKKGIKVRNFSLEQIADMVEAAIGTA
jgi:heterodisulfide reductase subunit A